MIAVCLGVGIQWTAKPCHTVVREAHVSGTSIIGVDKKRLQLRPFAGARLSDGDEALSATNSKSDCFPFLHHTSSSGAKGRIG